MHTRLLASLVATTSLFIGTTAFAQEPPSPAAPAAAPPAAAPPSVGAPAPGQPAPPEADKPAHGETDEEADAKGRLWIGFNAGGGVGTGADLSGPAFGLTFRIGWVMNSNMAVYGNLTGVAWVAGTSTTAPGGAKLEMSAVGGQLITPMFAYSPADIFEVALGPSLDHLAGGSASVSGGAAGTGASASAFDSFYFGAQGRLALHLGGRSDSHRRRGFTLSGDVHPSFVPNGPVTFMTLGLGADWF